MILEIRSDAREVEYHRNTVPLENRRRPNATPLQNRRRVEDSGGEYHLGLGCHIEQWTRAPSTSIVNGPNLNAWWSGCDSVGIHDPPPPGDWSAGRSVLLELRSYCLGTARVSPGIKIETGWAVEEHAVDGTGAARCNAGKDRSICLLSTSRLARVENTHLLAPG